MFKNMRLYLLIFCSISAVHPLKILGILSIKAYSHFIPFHKLLLGLTEKGHQVTMITPLLPNNSKEDMIEYISIEKAQSLERFTFEEIDSWAPLPVKTELVEMMKSLPPVIKLSVQSCKYLQSPVIQQFLRETRNYDIVMVNTFNSECFYNFAQVYQAQLVHFLASNLFPWHYQLIGQPNNPAYVPNFFSGYYSTMTFQERVKNTLGNTIYSLIYRAVVVPSNEPFISEAFGKNVSQRKNYGNLWLTNSHFTLTGVKPNLPGVIEIGGIHVSKESARKIPQNIEKWINDSKDGVIYFSMGSMIKGHTFPEEKRKIFLRAFGRLKQRVLWKWENETMPNKPENVMIQKWMPQFDILCHPNVKAFISHGGLLGTTEAVHCGVPVVVMPQFGDQHTNARALEAGGGGVVLNFREADEEMVYNALKTVLDPEFNKGAKELSARFRDRPMSPMDTAIYWIEYVARHKGAHHMRTAAVGMPLYQYLLLDVFAFLGACVLAVILVLYYITKFIIGLFRSGKTDKKKKVKKQ